MVNYIILGLLAAIFAVSVICVIAELVIPRKTAVGRFFRAVRIQLRTKSLTSLCVFAGVILIFGLVVRDSEMRLIFAALLIILLTLIVLLPGKFISIFRVRKRAKKKKLLPLAKLDKREVGELKELPELEPVTAEEVKG